MLIDTEKLKLKRDPHQWVLSLPKVGKNPKTQEPTLGWKESYHPSLRQVANHVAKNCAEGCVNIVQLEQVMGEFIERLASCLEQEQIKVSKAL
tara:strand:+ start:68 stop:346 length:279 start_codon:yes stop_codon:yes gene_type:complete